MIIIAFTTEWRIFCLFVFIVLFAAALVFRDSMPDLLVPEFSMIEGILEKIFKAVGRGNTL